MKFYWIDLLIQCQCNKIMIYFTIENEKAFKLPNYSEFPNFLNSSSKENLLRVSKIHIYVIDCSDHLLIFCLLCSVFIFVLLCSSFQRTESQWKLQFMYRSNIYFRLKIRIKDFPVFIRNLAVSSFHNLMLCIYRTCHLFPCVCLAINRIYTLYIYIMCLKILYVQC